MSYRLKLFALLLCVLAVFFALHTGYSALNTLSRLDLVEAQRDLWQQPAAILQALAIRPGDVIADLGCGSGYFSLKLSPQTGKTGRVYAEDIRRLPLIFLWFRAMEKGDRNIAIVHGDPADPHLPVNQVNDFLILNTYHELADSQAILAHVRESLVARGRLVIVDRTPNPSHEGDGGLAEHEISSERVETELRQAGFEIAARQDRFIAMDPDNESWWLIVALKPSVAESPGETR